MGLFLRNNQFNETIFTQQPFFVKQHQARFNLVCDQASAETDRKTNKRKYILCDI